MLKLKVTSAEYRSTLFLLREVSQNHHHLPHHHQSLILLVLEEYLNRINSLRLMAWAQRPVDKRYLISLPFSVAKALHVEMRLHRLSPFQQSFLARLDEAIVNYRPQAEPTAIGQLISLML